jgi:hypothetical protein
MSSGVLGRWKWAILASSLPAAARHVALTLAVRMSLDGTIPARYMPGTRGIARDTGQKADTVTASLRTLVESGYLTITRRSVGLRTHYAASLPDAEVYPETGTVGVPANGDGGVPPNAGSCTPKRVKPFPETGTRSSTSSTKESSTAADDDAPRNGVVVSTQQQRRRESDDRYGDDEILPACVALKGLAYIKSGDKSGIDRAIAEWHANGDDPA